MTNQAIKYYCIGDKPPIIAPRESYIHVSPNIYPWLNQLIVKEGVYGEKFHGSILSEYTQLFGLAEFLKDASSLEKFYIFQHHKFISFRPGTHKSTNQPYSYACSSEEGTTLFPSQDEISTLGDALLVGQAIKIRSIAHQYSELHFVEDFSKFVLSLRSLNEFDEKRCEDFINCEMLLLAPSLGVTQVDIFLKHMGILKLAWEHFSNHFLILHDGHQRQVGRFLLERLHSFLLYEEINIKKNFVVFQGSEIITSEPSFIEQNENDGKHQDMEDKHDRADKKTLVSMLSLSEQLALEDGVIEKQTSGRRFSLGAKPVIRWIKGNGLDDQVTKAAIGQATRLFGSSVDYCLCTNDIDAARVRNILEWAAQPVEWWPVDELDNPKLAEVLINADCPPSHFGYWWKWFPERVRPNAPEWILDGDMVITAKPPWFEQWRSGGDVLRIAQYDFATPEIYGNYAEHVNLDLKLYSGLVSLPPKVRYIDQFLAVLQIQPLVIPHDGRKDMCEQGVAVATFGKLDALPIPLYEFPFCIASQSYIDYGIHGNRNQVWGYHFGRSFVMNNPHFDRLTQEGTVFFKPQSSQLTFRELSERFKWLGNVGQWGVPGWAIPDEIAIQICIEAQAYAAKEVLELGTSRGYLSAMLASLGCKLTTVDHQDRGAIQNLAGLNVTVVVEDAVEFLTRSNKKFDLIVVDVHGNTPQDWARLEDPLIAQVKRGSKLVIDNAALYEIPEWKDETGVQWFLDQLPKTWHIKINKEYVPGIATVSMD